MTTQSIALFTALGSKMDFLNQRQGIIAQNVSNADTPGYRPRDLVQPDFSKVLKNVSQKGGLSQVRMEATSKDHLGAVNGTEEPDARKQRDTYEVALGGNAVIMEEQLIKANENIMDYNLITNLYQKNVGLIKTALGKGR